MYRKWCETHLLCGSMFSVCFYIFVAVISQRCQIGVYTFFPGYQLNQQIDLNHLRALFIVNSNSVSSCIHLGKR